MRLSAGVGAVAWAGSVIERRPDLQSPDWAGSLVVFAAAVLVPAAMSLVVGDRGARPWGWAVGFGEASALLLIASFGRPPGPISAILSGPWLVTTAFVAILGLLRLRDRGFRSIGEVSIAVGMMYLAVGGAWASAARLGFRPMGFADLIVLLTADHFHYAGFVLPIVVGLAARRVGGRMSVVAGWGVILAVPAVASGITATQMGLSPRVETACALFMAGSGVLAALLLLRVAFSRGQSAVSRVAWAGSAGCLAFGMVLATLYGSRTTGLLPRVEIPRMILLHGTVNGLGFGSLALLGWLFATPPPIETPDATVASRRPHV